LNNTGIKTFYLDVQVQRGVMA